MAVKFSRAATDPQVVRTLARVQAQESAAVNRLGYVTYTIPSDRDPAAIAASIAGTPGIVEAKPLGARYLDFVPSDQEFGPAPPYTGPYTTPPQPSQVQWDMWYTQMPAAWDITQGNSGVLIAIIDSGYDANNIDICSKVVNSAVFDNGSGNQDFAANAQDDDGHGSNVSGIAASVTNNSTRYAGAGFNVDLLEVRVFKQPTPANPNPPGATSADVAAAIDWAITNHAKVINLSLGATSVGNCDPGEQAAINNAVNNNVVVVVASGNDGTNTLKDPANCNGVIVVGASALNDTSNPASPTEYVPAFSNYSGSTSWGLVAPGGDPTNAQLSCGVAPLCDFLQWIVNNYSTTACCANSSPPNVGNHGVLINGTSMAAPHVAGVAALMISRDPGITPAQVASILESTADNICGCASSPDQQGAGRLNAASALAATP
jgi:serine protease